MDTGAIPHRVREDRGAVPESPFSHRRPFRQTVDKVHNRLRGLAIPDANALFDPASRNRAALGPSGSKAQSSATALSSNGFARYCRGGAGEQENDDQWIDEERSELAEPAAPMPRAHVV